MSPISNSSDSSKVIVLKKKSTNMVEIALQKYPQNIHSHSPWNTIPKKYMPARCIANASRICHIKIMPKFNLAGWPIEVRPTFKLNNRQTLNYIYRIIPINIS